MMALLIVLGCRDSNPDTMIQSHVSCRWTTPQSLFFQTRNDFRAFFETTNDGLFTQNL